MIICIKMDLALNNLQRLICHKTQQTKPNQKEIRNIYRFFTRDPAGMLKYLIPSPPKKKEKKVKSMEPHLPKSLPPQKEKRVKSMEPHLPKSLPHKKKKKWNLWSHTCPNPSPQKRKKSEIYGATPAQIPPPQKEKKVKSMEPHLPKSQLDLYSYIRSR